MTTIKITHQGATKMAGIAPVVGGENAKALQATKENVEVLTGVRGNPLDQAVTYRALLDQGIVELARNNINIGGGNNVEIKRVTQQDDLAIPPTPTGLQANATFTEILLSWDQVLLDNFNIYSHTEIYRNTSDTLGSAIIIGTTSGSHWTDSVGYGQTRYYWIRHVSNFGVKSPYHPTVNGESATTLASVSATMTQLTENITALPGYSDLITSTIPTLISNAGTASTQIIRATSAPTQRADGTALQLVDIWVDTTAGNDNQMYVRNAANNGWVKARDSSLVDLVGLQSGSGAFNGSSLSVAMATAQSDHTTLATSVTNLSSSRNRTFLTGTTPTASAVGDLWIDTGNDNKMKRWDGTTWVDSQDSRIAATSTALASLTTATTATGSGVTSHATRLNSLESILGDGTDFAQATALTTTNTNVSNNAGNISANATNLSNLTATVGSGNDADGNAYSSTNTIAQHVTATEDNAQSSLVLQTNANGAVAQMILHSNASAGTSPTSVITFEADTFAIWDGSGSAASNSVAPFIIDGGVVYMDTARIKDGAIENAKIGSLNASKINAGSLSADRIATSSLSFDKIIGNTVDVNTSQITNAAITNAKLANASIDTAKVGSLYANTLSGDVSKAVAGSLASTVSYQNRSDTFSSAIVELALAKPTHINGWNPYAAYNINKVNTEKNSWMYVCLEMAVWNVNSQGGTSTETAATSATTSAFGNGYTGAAITSTFLTGVSGSHAANVITVNQYVATDVVAGDIVFVGSEERTVTGNAVVLGSRIIGYSGSSFSGSPTSFSFKESVTSGNGGKYVKVAEIQWVAVDTAFNDFAISGTFNANGAAVQHGVKARVRMKGQSTGSDQGTLTINITEATGFLMGVR